MTVGTVIGLLASVLIFHSIMKASVSKRATEKKDKPKDKPKPKK